MDGMTPAGENGGRVVCSYWWLADSDSKQSFVPRGDIIIISYIGRLKCLAAPSKTGASLMILVVITVGFV